MGAGRDAQPGQTNSRSSEISLSLPPPDRTLSPDDAVAPDPGPDSALINELSDLRVRMAMELHDGILQTLTGASLQIAVARRLLHENPDAAEKVLAALGDTISAEQQEMRLFVDELKGLSPLSSRPSVGMRDAIASLLDRVHAIWGVSASLQVELEEEPPPDTARHILRVIQEATVNAARHGGAQAVSVQVERAGADVALRITDDGHGFPFLGELDMEALKERRLGPLSLKHRVQACGGRLAIRSTREGATVSIWLPGWTEGGA